MNMQSLPKPVPVSFLSPSNHEIEGFRGQQGSWEGYGRSPRVQMTRYRRQLEVGDECGQSSENGIKNKVLDTKSGVKVKILGNFWTVLSRNEESFWGKCLGIWENDGISVNGVQIHDYPCILYNKNMQL